MTRHVSIWAILLIILCTNNSYAKGVDSAKIVSSLNKCWKAFSHDYSSIYGLEEDEIKAYSKQRVCFTTDSVNMFYGNVYSPTYAIKKVDAEKYTRDNYECSKSKFNIYIDSVYEVTVFTMARGNKDGKMRKMTDVLLYDGICIYMVLDGVFFKMIDADSKVTPAGGN
jgi:hypothetical protein